MHALFLRDRGWQVDHLEADLVPQGASVRNFGLIWVGGRRSGPELEAAQRARTLWEEVADRVPATGFRAAGSLTIARSEGERKVMEAFAVTQEATDRGTTFLEPAAVRHKNRAVGGSITGALFCERDAIVEPRVVPRAMSEYLARSEGYRLHAGRRAIEVKPGAVRDQRGTTWSGDLVVIAPGASPAGEIAGVVADTLAAAPVRRVRLQMLQTAPLPTKVSTSIADADSLRYYPAYECVDLAPLGEQDEVAKKHQAQLLLAQRLDGGLTIGDTHEYGEPFAFDLDDAPSEHLLNRVEQILGVPVPAVQRRWEGVYVETVEPGRLWYREEIEADVWLVTGPGGRGMTCSPAIAEETLVAADVTDARSHS